MLLNISVPLLICSIPPEPIVTVLVSVVAGDPEFRVEAVFTGQDDRYDTVVVAIPTPELQRAQRRLKGVFLCDVAGVPDIFHDEVEDRAQLTRVVTGRAMLSHGQPKLAHCGNA